MLVLVVISGCSAAPLARQVEAPAPIAAPTDAPTPVVAEPTPEPTEAAVSPVPAAVEPANAAASAAPPNVDDTQPIDDGTAPGAGALAPPPGPQSVVASTDASCDDTIRPDPLPVAGSPRSQDFFRSFREPLAPAPLFDPPGPKRVGLQAGHWLNEQVPPELGRLQAGAVGGGKQEWQVNLEVANRAAALLEAAGIQTDVLPATVPPRYQANLFLAIHSDGDPAGQARGFKVARPGFSSLPDVDDRLVEALNRTYGVETELPRDDEHISLRMRYYYAFNSRRYCHAVARGVPQAILEMGYLTSAVDRQYLIGDPDRLAHAVADSLESFLATLP